MSELSSFTYDFDGERLSGVYGDSDGDGGSPGSATVVLLHGAGASGEGRLVPLLDEFVARGCRGIAFDFSGHGDTTGALRELSDARKPMFDLRPADGALGSTQQYVKTCFKEFRALAQEVLARIGELPEESHRSPTANRR